MKRALTALALMTAASAATIAATPAADARTGSDLSTVIAFENPADPWLSERSDSIFNPVWAKAPSQLAIPGEGLVRVSAGNAPDGWVSHRVDLAGEWNGLSLKRFDLNGVPHSGVGSYVLHFNEAPAILVARLDRLGFPVNRIGSDVTTGESDCGAKLRVDGQALTSTFTISFHC